MIIISYPLRHAFGPDTKISQVMWELFQLRDGDTGAGFGKRDLEFEGTPEQEARFMDDPLHLATLSGMLGIELTANYHETKVE